ncbi:ExbD/TolR family protein [Basilea psittacipulmonis]|uniref:Biopolymer transporter ExbD n=1 Tax=Basilea psittacipulmonis DSM 24701 TaxID=1072685 RepID=A0A077DCV9_9BURK|nr:biopolymer transporter ExbD [Basilea psittacipulmonis]AIL32715.1 hypothetical protein IX83_04800 [Basilea psittacipulmonis DSM 24701]
MAFGGLNNSGSNEMSDINVTPLVDVMLVLMIVFMIAMPVFTSSIKVQLPKSGTQEKLEDTDLVRVVIKPTGEYFVNDKEVSINTIRAELAEIYQKNNAAVIAIQADKTAQYEYVAKVLDEARQIGLTKIGFVTEVKQK